ncbi:MAG: RNA-directed DNA polymerase [Parcubacteria group bacterium GW2011_GWB1_35_5]|nr:MAG: RNA-directed DNA polymerase [Parcubacteria group bacterium GW2011_GWB1_35_5]
MKETSNIEYKNIISLENLLEAWQGFLVGKKSKSDVLEFQKNLMRNIINLHHDLTNKLYQHGGYKAFNISDPKPRNIHKASVRDRLLHHAVYRVLYPYFDPKFISDSFSCRLDKGTNKAINRFRSFGQKVSKNHTKMCWVLKCDIKKFFASIDQETLLNILNKYIADKNINWLLERVIKSFYSTKENIGLPLGNLTSQLLVNIYMNQFDQWVKHKIKVKHYVRYADDFVILSQDKDYLLELIPKIADFLDEELKLILHPNKITLKTFASGVDFLGWVHFPKHRVLRMSTKRRVLRALEESKNLNSLISYAGLLSHGNQYQLQTEFLRKIEEIEKRSSEASINSLLN